MKLRPPTKMIGGKAYLVHKFLPIAPKNPSIFISPCLGMGSFEINYPKAPREVWSDSNPDVINFWKVLQQDCDAFLDAISWIEYKAESFLTAKNAGTIEKLQDPPGFTGNWRVDHAIAFFCRHRMSRSGDTKAFSWSDRLRRGKPEGISAWETIQTQLPHVSDRIQDVEFRCGDAIGLLREFREEKSCFAFIDPPYLLESRVSKKLYVHEMTREDHFALLSELRLGEYAFMLCGYQSKMYDACAEACDWDLAEFPVKCSAGQTKTKTDRVECVWRNRRCLEMV